MSLITNDKEYLEVKKKVQDLSLEIIKLQECGNRNGYCYLFHKQNELERLKQALRDFDAISAANRKGDWMPVFSGRRFWLLDPRPEDIDICDIARGLSNMCRFNGHLRKFYSVAQHSLLASDFASEKNKLHALLHDASESYCGDVISPLKPLLTDYKAIERKVMEAIAKRFEFDLDDDEEIKEIDERLLATEVRDLVPAQVINWRFVRPPYQFTIIPWNADEAYDRFLHRFEDLIAWRKHLNQITVAV